jgi:hypothetical protein
MDDDIEHGSPERSDQAAPSGRTRDMRSDSAFLGASACAVSSVFAATHSSLATLAVAGVAVVLALRSGRG